jgi:hypothetical protein
MKASVQPKMRQLALMVLLSVVLPVSSMAMSPLPQTTLPSDSVPVIPAGAVVDSAHTIHGKKAALQLAMQAGISVAALQTRFGTSPFDPNSTDVSVTLTGSQVTSADQAVFDVLHGTVHTNASEGDTQTYTWREGCGVWSETFTFEDGQWVVTKISWTAVPGCKAPTG